jgi:predicted AAA+ superfamily ATPase
MESREKLKKVLYEWSEFNIPELCRRDFDVNMLKSKEILSIIGARRAGKTFLCYQMIKELRRSNPAENIIYINFEDERLYPFKGDELSIMLDVCREIFSVNMDKKLFLFVDEIQNVQGWSKWARRITDQNQNIKLVITGSSSRLLSKEIATELRGRTLSWQVFPFSFSEYLRMRGKDISGKNILYSKERPVIKRYFNEYISTGGFPAVLQSENPRDLLREYYNVMFYRDLVERYSIENIRLLEDYLTLLIDQTACSFSISATAKKLTEFGHSFSKNTLTNYTKYAQEAFLVFEAKKYSFKVREQMRAPKKLYVVDHGLVQAVRFSFQDNYGRMMENMAYIELKRKGKEVYYYKGKHECEFIVVESGRVAEVMQITKSISDVRVREREISGIREAMKYFKLRKGLVLTEDENEEIRAEEGKILIEPLWYWLLNNK